MNGNWSCPLPLRHYPAIVMGHGAGGKLSSELVEHLFLPAFRNDTLATLGDAALLDLPLIMADPVALRLAREQ